MYNILLLDDEPAIVNAMRRVIARIPSSWLAQPCSISGFTDPDIALHALAETDYDVVVADLRMPRMSGLDFLRHAQTLQPDATRIIVSGHGDFTAVLAALNETQVFRFVPKPWNDRELQLAMVQALLTRDLQRENQQLADQVRAGGHRGYQPASSLRKLEAECPGITHVERDEYGAICIDEAAL
jgi:YesN/AraC family two-component response regulator